MIDHANGGQRVLSVNVNGAKPATVVTVVSRDRPGATRYGVRDRPGQTLAGFQVAVDHVDQHDRVIHDDARQRDYTEAAP